MNENIKIPRRKREKLQRRQDILDAAKKVFADDGFDNANLDDIAARCELSKGSIYYYFASKEDLFLSVLEEGFEEFSSELDKAIQAKNPRESIERITEYIVNYFTEDYDRFRVVFRERMKGLSGSSSVYTKHFNEKSKEIERKLSEVFQRGIDAGEIKNYDPSTLVNVLLGMIHFSTIICRTAPPIGAKTLTSILFDGIQK